MEVEEQKGTSNNTNKNPQSGKKFRGSAYNNERFPNFFKNSFEREREQYFNEFVCFFEKIELDHRHEYFIDFIPNLEKLTKVYGLSLRQRESIATLLLRAIFENDNLTIGQRNIFFNSLSLINSSHQRFTHLKLNWKCYLEYLTKYYFSNERVSHTSPTHLWSQFSALIKEINRNKAYFDDSSINEVLAQFKQKLCPDDNSLYSALFFLFLKISRKGSPELYQSLLDQIMDMRNWTFKAINQAFVMNMVCALLR